jgi:hypothetical protein
MISKSGLIRGITSFLSHGTFLLSNTQQIFTKAISLTSGKQPPCPSCCGKNYVHRNQTSATGNPADVSCPLHCTEEEIKRINMITNSF